MNRRSTGDAMKRRKRRKPGGAKRMADLGHKQVQLWLDVHEQEAIVPAAADARLPLATYIRRVAFLAATGRLKPVDILPL